MNEDNIQIVNEKSMFVNQQRWTDVFSPLFDFFNGNQF